MTIGAILATWFLIGSFVTPSPRPARYVGERVSTAGNAPAAVYQRRGTVYVTPVPKLAGQRDSLWVSLSDAWLGGGGYAHRVWPVSAAGDSGAPWYWPIGAATVNACTLSCFLPATTDSCGRWSVPRPETGLDSLFVLGNRPDCCTDAPRIVARFGIRGLEGTRVRLIFPVPAAHRRYEFWALSVDRAGNGSCALSKQANWMAR